MRVYSSKSVEMLIKPARSQLRWEDLAGAVIVNSLIFKFVLLSAGMIAGTDGVVYAPFVTI
jgi:hypothetical protein